MPTHIRAQCTFQVDTALPADVHQITPCFRHTLGLLEGDPEWDDLADDLATALDGWAPLSTGEVVVKLYDIEGTDVPNRPKATAVKNPGTTFVSQIAREPALCLSFNGGNNAPKNRGRLYVPCWICVGNDKIPTRPIPAHRQKCADLVPIFSDLGGVNVDWIVWSPTNESATKVERWYVDDEWDVIRKRGLAPSMRLTGTTGG